MLTKTEQTIRVDIYIAGDLEQAKQVCREYAADRGECVHVEPVDFIYKYGEESGVKVGFINYPRFPRDEEALIRAALDLGYALLRRLCQGSFSVVAPSRTIWVTRREQDGA